MLAARGYRVVAVTGKKSSTEYLRQLGAARVLLRDAIDTGSRPHGRSAVGGAIDNVGGELLTWLTRTTNFWGNIASIGLASSHELKTTVMPFILRGVSLLGINSVLHAAAVAIAGVAAPGERPQAAPSREHRHAHRELDQLPTAFEGYLEAGITGRTVVRIATLPERSMSRSQPV